ncbi:MAG: site-specific DNA-methyltransferase, partial [Anaerolineae bacterium]|nr:site-specific DNA-methyltransferase [Anaerolineae bacterium]
MPNFHGTRLKNDVEFIIWAKKSEMSKYHINYHLLKQFNEGKQLGSVWEIPICSGAERLTDSSGNKLHSTQKPEELLRRILLASGKPGNLVLDPFSGTGTTAVIARELHMRWLGIESDERYIQPSRERIAAREPLAKNDPLFMEFSRKKPPRVPFVQLIEAGYLQVGQVLHLHNANHRAKILANGKLCANEIIGTIHGLARELKNLRAANGW